MSIRSWSRRTALASTCVATLAAGLSAPAAAAASPSPAPVGDRQAAAPTSEADLDVLFIGAHPDDEAGRLSVYGHWAERYGVKTGVLTITRGEGGGNAIGPEEGPALGKIREAEERRAVGRAGITDVYNLDEVDFYYTVSASLTQQIWRHRDTLRKVVRIVRETTPDVIVTMDPAPSPGNHGNHQYAALMALEAYHKAGTSSVFPGQLRNEGLSVWSPDKVFLSSARGTATGTGSSCATKFTPVRPTQNIYGIWGGIRSEDHDTTWAQVEREAQREYASQGWSGFPDMPADPELIGCDFLVQVDSRVPYTRGDLSAAAADDSTMLEGALLREPGGLPLGTGLDLSTDDFSVVPGGRATVAVALTAPRGRDLVQPTLRLRAPAGWTAPGTLSLRTVKAGRTVTRRIVVRAPADAVTNQRVLVGGTVRSAGRTGYGDLELEVTPVVRGTQQLLPQVSQFQRWATANGYPQMEGFVKPVLSLASGGERRVAVDVVNNGDAAQSGTVTLDLPDGFAADPAAADYADLAPGATTTVDFTVTNTDDTLPTSNAGGTAGDYDYTVQTTSGAGSSSTAAALELVPTTTIEEATDVPVVDGAIAAGEYAGEPIDLSRLWEGTPCESAADCSATGHLTRHGDDLYVAVDVTDDVLGTTLDASDCKRHWRTDSVEIALDPDGGSENTSTTFKALVLPTTTEGEPCYGRDADNRQGPGAQTAPGMVVDAQVSDPYLGYVVEAKIPAGLLPSSIDPEHLGLNAFVYDSDTQDKTGQTRLGWSTFGGVQGDPYRWGVATLPGWNPPQVGTQAPDVPSVALESVDSPQSIAQAVRTGVPLAGKRAAGANRTAVLAGARQHRRITTILDVSGPGTAHLFAMARGRVVGSKVVELTGPGRAVVRLAAQPGARRVLLAYASDAGGTTSTAARIR